MACIIWPLLPSKIFSSSEDAKWAYEIKHQDSKSKKDGCVPFFWLQMIPMLMLSTRS